MHDPLEVIRCLSLRVALRRASVLPFLLFSISCQTVEDAWNQGPKWSFIPMPQRMGPLAHSLCGGNGGLFMAFGGIEEGRVSPLSGKMIVYDSLENFWQLADDRDGPSARNFASLTLMDQKAYVFGGETAQNVETADAFVYDPSARAWSSLPVPESVIPRKQASLTRVGSELVIFGGKGTVPVTNWARYRPSVARWQVHSYFPGMAPRVAHIALGLDESRLLIWGGFEGKERRGDGFIFDLKSQTIKPIPSFTPRANARALLLGDNVLVWGGAGVNGHVADGALLNVNTLHWTSLPSIPDPRFQKLQGAEVVAQGPDSFLLFGGRFGSDAFNDQLWTYDITRAQWSLLRTDENPEGRMAHCFVTLDPRKYAVFGGIGFEKGTQSLKQFDGLWILDL